MSSFHKHALFLFCRQVWFRLIRRRCALVRRSGIGLFWTFLSKSELITGQKQSVTAQCCICQRVYLLRHTQKSVRPRLFIFLFAVIFKILTGFANSHSVRSFHAISQYLHVLLSHLDPTTIYVHATRYGRYNFHSRAKRHFFKKLCIPSLMRLNSSCYYLQAK